MSAMFLFHSDDPRDMQEVTLSLEARSHAIAEFKATARALCEASDRAYPTREHVTYGSMSAQMTQYVDQLESRQTFFAGELMMFRMAHHHAHEHLLS